MVPAERTALVSRQVCPEPTEMARTGTIPERPECARPERLRAILSYNIRTVQWEDTPRRDGDNPLRKVRRERPIRPERPGIGLENGITDSSPPNTPRDNGDGLSMHHSAMLNPGHARAAGRDSRKDKTQYSS